MSGTKETFHFAPSEEHGGAPTAEAVAKSVSGGKYCDPPLSVVKYINERFTDPNENIQATLMKAFELAGIVKTIKDIRDTTQPLEQSGLLPTGPEGDKPPEYLSDPAQTSEFIDLRDEQLLLELQEGNDARNNMLLKVIETIERRSAYDGKQERELWEFRGTYMRRNEAPQAFRIIRVMVGIDPPEDPKNMLESKAPEVTSVLAPDVYWMILREELETRSQATGAVA